MSTNSIYRTRRHIDLKSALMVVAGSVIFGYICGPLLAVALCPNLTIHQETNRVVQR